MSLTDRISARLILDRTTVSVECSPLAKVLGLFTSQSIPLRNVTRVSLVEDPIRCLAGARSPGFALPGLAKVGIWRSKGKATFVIVRRGQRAVFIEAEGQRYDAYLVGLDDAPAYVRMLEATRS